MDREDRFPLEDLTTKILEGDKYITVLDTVVRLPPEERFELPMTNP